MKGLVYLNNRGKVTMDETTGIMALPAEQQRFLWYTRKITTEFPITQTWSSDDDVYFYVKETMVNVRFNNKLYCKFNPMEGFAYNRVTKDIKPWFGKSMKAMQTDMLIELFTECNLDWLKDALNSNGHYKKMLDLGILKRILKGKITNRLDLVKAYVKSSPSFAGARTMPISKIVKFLNAKSYNNLDDMISYIKLSVVPEATANAVLDTCVHTSFLKHWEDPHQSWINFGTDIMHQARVLGRKIDFTWSYKRMMQVHDEWTNEIMGLELTMVPDTKFGYNGELALPDGIKLIDNSKDLFKEGTEMKHCVYTNHRYEVMDRKEFIFCGAFDGARFTVSVIPSYRYGEEPKVFGISQMYGKHNLQVNKRDKLMMEQWVAEEPVQAWLRANYNDGKDRPQVELGDMLPF